MPSHRAPMRSCRRRHRRPGGRLRAASPSARSFVLLERAPRAGGVILSEESTASPSTRGPDALLIQKPDGDQAVRGARSRRPAGRRPSRRASPSSSAAGGCIRCRPPRCSAFRRGSVRSSRTRPVLLAGQGAHGRGAVRAARGATTRDESIGAFMTRRFGAEATTYLAEPLLAGIHAGDVDRLSVRALFPRFVEAERTHGSLLRAFRSRRPAPAPRPSAGRRVSSRCPAA